jgi:hypothetical protein
MRRMWWLVALSLTALLWLTPAQGSAGLTASLSGNGTGTLRYEERASPVGAVAWRLRVRVAAVNLLDEADKRSTCRCKKDHVIDVVINAKTVRSFTLQRDARVGEMCIENSSGAPLAKRGDLVSLVDRTDGTTLQQGRLR